MAWSLVGALYFTLGFMGLSAYGATWDELENLYAGETHLHFLATGDGRFLDYSRNQLAGSEAKLYWEYSRFPERYPPATNILAAALKHVLSDWLGWLHPLDGYHSLIVALASLLVASVVAVAYRRAGPLAALAAGLALGFHPRFFSDIHNNIKDVPEAVWYSLALLLAHRAQRDSLARGARSSWGAWLLTGLCLGLALATKPNALMWPIVFGAWLTLDHFRRGADPRAWRSSLAALSLALCLAFVTAVACWPWLWAEGLASVPDRVASYYAYLQLVSENKQGFSLLAPFYLLIVTPPWVLGLAALGIGKVVHDLRQRADRDGFGLLLLVWLVVPLIRVCLPRARFYDGIRHFLEVVPALALFAGLGAAWLAARLGQLSARPRVAASVLGLAAATGAALPIVLYHPHENVYFNTLVGGYAGARERKVPWAGEYWSGSLREAVEWINLHGERGFHIAALNAGHLLATLSVRPDLILDPDPDAAKHLPQLAAKGRPMRYYAIETRDVFPHVSELGTLVHERWRDRGPVFRIYRIEREMARASVPQVVPKASTVRPLRAPGL